MQRLKDLKGARLFKPRAPKICLIFASYPIRKVHKRIRFDALDLFRIAFAASAVHLIASAADLDMFERAVAAAVVVLTGCYVASYAVINVFHKITSVIILCRNG